MKTNLLLMTAFASVLLLFGCNTKKEQPSSDMECETIDFFSYRMVEDDMPEAIIKEKKYIKLDNSQDDFLFKSIDKLKIRDDRIYVLDSWMKKLIVFDRAGTGIGTVGRIGQGPGEYLRISDFDINESGDIYFIDGTGNNDRLFVFDKNLRFVSTRNLPFDADIIQCLPEGKLLFGLASWNKKDYVNQKIALTNAELETEQTYMEFDEFMDDNFWISDYVFVNMGDRILYNKPIDNKVYEFSPDGHLRKAYLFDFGHKNVPDEDKKDIEGNLDKFERYCCLKDFTVVADNYILGTLWAGRQTKSFIIDRKNKVVYQSKALNYANINGYYNNQLISSVFPGKYEDIQTTGFPADIKKYVEDENFALCLYELK
jgi:hypothetical protein